jgi:hypothetical protein
MLIYLTMISQVKKEAERERFELSEGITPSTVFETVPFNHSGISPYYSSNDMWLFPQKDISFLSRKYNILPDGYQKSCYWHLCSSN